VREGGRLSCPRSNEAAAKRALARLLAAAEKEGHHAVVEVLRKSGARPMANHELAEVTREEASSDGRVGARATPMESRSPFAQLLQNSAEYRDFSVNLGKQYETIGKLLGYKLASPHAPSIRYDSAYDRPPAETRRASILFRPALQAAASGHSASLRTMGYAVVGPVYEPPVLQLLQEHYNDLIGSGALGFSDPQSHRYVARNEKVSRLVHEDLTPLVSLIVGRRVEPTYSYFSGYVRNSELPLHTDRDDCEYTVSLLLERKPSGIGWPIYLEKRAGTGLTPGPKRHVVGEGARTALDCGENAFMIFKGRHHAHFREAFKGEHAYILLLHYVHHPAEQALLRNGEEGVRGEDVASAMSALADGERIVRVDGGDTDDDAELATNASLEYVYVPRSEHFFYPGHAVGHRQQLVRPPLALETLSLSPRIFRVDGFLSEDECAHIMRLAQPVLRPSILQSRGHPQQVEGGTVDTMRTSETAWLDRFFGVNRGAPETEVTRSVVLRAVEMARVPADTHAEGLQVLRYSVGGAYRHHLDWLPGHHPARLATVLIFLNDDATASAEFGRLEGGGGTNFALEYSQEDLRSRADCKSGATIAPRAGTAIFFYNLLPGSSATRDYAMDWASWHSGCNVTAGVKWIANVWIRNDPTKW